MPALQEHPADGAQVAEQVRRADISCSYKGTETRQECASSWLPLGNISLGADGAPGEVQSG
jgi:hypothetical protein